MNGRLVTTSTWGNLMLAAVLSAVWQSHSQCAQAQDAKPAYPAMAPTDRYLMSDRNAEIALARTAAPKSISADATVMVLTRHGYETAVKGTNGFVCIVDRAWSSPFDDPGFWNPKNRSPICYNPPAARSSLLYTFNRVKLVLAGMTKAQMLERIKTAVANKELPTPEPGAMSYMLSKESYLNDQAGHWVPHLMFHIPKTDGASWGANLDGSPVMVASYQVVPEPETVFLVPVAKWSDGTPASPM
jgi:hypothetical protein